MYDKVATGHEATSDAGPVRDLPGTSGVGRQLGGGGGRAGRRGGGGSVKISEVERVSVVDQHALARRLGSGELGILLGILARV